jgi:hypothetical protein
MCSAYCTRAVLRNKLTQWNGIESFVRSRQLLSYSISQLLWNQKVLYRIRKSLPLVPSWDHINAVYTTLYCFCKITLKLPLFRLLQLCVWC